MSATPLRVLFALPGFHRVSRGAETALEAVARELAKREDFSVTLIGSGPPRAGEPYRYVQVPVTPRERFEKWPRVPPLRNEYRWEELSFARPLRRTYRPADFDVTLTCSYPFVNWVLRAGRRDKRPRHVFVTQNGDWPAQRRNAEYRFFSCDGLVCTNPDYHERQKTTWKSALIPNGIDAKRFVPGPADRRAFALPPAPKIVLMASALIASKRVLEAIPAIAAIPDAFLVVAGDGPLRTEFDALAREHLPGRHTRLTTTPDRMPALYRCADAFLHMSREEAFGNVYIEALACGLPVVAHDYPTARWILAEKVPTIGKTGSANFQSLENPPPSWLVDTSDPSALTAALTAALAASRENVAGRHACAAARFDWPIVGAQYAAFLREVAG